MNSLEELFGLRGKRALVTGASSGLGVEFARGLALAGADVALLARRKERLEALAQELAAQGVRSLAVQADVTDDAQIERAVTEVEAAWGGVDILVNNAGNAPGAPAEGYTLEQWNSVIALNLTAVFRMAQRVAQGMIGRGQGGRIINIASAAAHRANNVTPVVGYTASKSAVAGLTRQLAIEWAQHNITVNCISPGWFPSEITVDARFGDIHPKLKPRMVAGIPLGRLGQSGELMGAAILLASAAGAYVTGESLVVDGGLLA